MKRCSMTLEQVKEYYVKKLEFFGQLPKRNGKNSNGKNSNSNSNGSNVDSNVENVAKGEEYDYGEPPY